MKLQQSMCSYPGPTAGKSVFWRIVNIHSLPSNDRLLSFPSLLAGTALCIITLLTADVPTATAQVRAADRTVDAALAASPSMVVTLGQTAVLKVPVPLRSLERISVGNPQLADVFRGKSKLAELDSPIELYVSGRFTGTTNLILWFRDKQTMVIDLAVILDAPALQRKLLEFMPGEKDIKVSAAADSLVLYGSVSDTIKADRAVAIADAYVRAATINRITMMMSPQSDGRINNMTVYGEGVVGGASGGAGGMGGGMGMMAAMMGAGQGGAGTQQGAGAGLGTVTVINLLQIGSNQQVMLEVKVMEINRTVAEKLGFDFQRAVGKAGSATKQIFTGIIGGLPGKLFEPSVPVGGTAPGDSWLIDAERKDGVIRVLAEPNIVAISGQEASFLVGGEIMIPIPSGSAGGAVTLSSKQFGVGLRFTPTVLDGDRINLVVAPEVTELVGFNTVATTGFGQILSVPTFTTRRISTTVQLRDGQALAIGGLLQDNFKEQVKRFPLLGEIPMLGALFRSSDFQTNKTELMIVVTPRLVKPLPPDYKVPTDAFIPPSRSELIMDGKMEGTLPKDESPAKTAPNTGVQPQAQPLVNNSGNPADAGGFQMK